MDTKVKIDTLRKLMKDRGWDAAVISGGDPHSDEYVPERWQARKWLSGFTGSAGDIVVTYGHAGLWTDGRYFIQASKELEGSGIEIHKTRIPGAIGIPEWLGMEASKKPGFKIGIDGLTVNSHDALEIIKNISPHGGSIDDAPDFITEIWHDRPEYPQAGAGILADKYAGRTRSEKLSWLRGKISEAGCGAMLLSSLDEIAWLLNIRGGDIAYNPLLLSYMVVTENRCMLFTESCKFSGNDLETLCKDGIEILPYDSIDHEIVLRAKEGGKMLIDGQTLNYHLYGNILQSFGHERVCDSLSPVPLEKAVKNKTEIKGMKKAALMDGIALTKFFIWLNGQMKLVKKGKTLISEADAAEKLNELRKSTGALDESFATISAYGKNAALPHYSAIKGKCSYLEPKGLYLVDSGGQYPYGTTDITRTIPLGPTSKREKRDYTLVLKGMISLALSVFPHGTAGTNIDALARNPLWQHRLDFGHGTGHGVGHRLCVHEGPQAIRHNWIDCPILPGMITSDEPGLYIEGEYGIRHENLLLCKETGKNSCGEWLCFETVTYTYIDTSSVHKSLLSKDEIKWLNRYNSMVYSKLHSFLDKDERKWLEKRCRPI